MNQIFACFDWFNNINNTHKKLTKSFSNDIRKTVFVYTQLSLFTQGFSGVIKFYGQTCVQVMFFIRNSVPPISSNIELFYWKEKLLPFGGKKLKFLGILSMIIRLYFLSPHTFIAHGTVKLIIDVSYVDCKKRCCSELL